MKNINPFTHKSPSVVEGIIKEPLRTPIGVTHKPYSTLMDLMNRTESLQKKLSQAFPINQFFLYGAFPVG